MRIFTNIIKRITTVSGNITSRQDVTPAIAISQRFALSGNAITPAAAIAIGPIAQRSALSQALSIAHDASGEPFNSQAPALQLAQRFGLAGTDNLPAMNFVQLKIDLNRRVGGSSSSQTAVGGRSDWANIANATGLHDSSMATFAGNALGARGGQVELDYANIVNARDLTITAAYLHFYGRVFNTSLNNADVQLKYLVSGTTFTTLETITGNADFRVTPKTHDISAALTTWTLYDGLRSAVSASSAIAETWQAELDAVEVEVVASITDTL